VRSVDYLSPGGIKTNAFGQIGGHDVAISVLPVSGGRTSSVTRLENLVPIHHVLQKLHFDLMDRNSGGSSSSKHITCLGTISAAVPTKAEGVQFDMTLTRQCRAKTSSLHSYPSPTYSLSVMIL
jgi:hypothetical protein